MSSDMMDQMIQVERKNSGMTTLQKAARFIKKGDFEEALLELKKDKNWENDVKSKSLGKALFDIAQNHDRGSNFENKVKATLLHLAVVFGFVGVTFLIAYIYFDTSGFIVTTITLSFILPVMLHNLFKASKHMCFRCGFLCKEADQNFVTESEVIPVYKCSQCKSLHILYFGVPIDPSLLDPELFVSQKTIQSVQQNSQAYDESEESSLVAGAMIGAAIINDLEEEDDDEDTY